MPCSSPACLTICETLEEDNPTSPATALIDVPIAILPLRTTVMYLSPLITQIACFAR